MLFSSSPRRTLPTRKKFTDRRSRSWCSRPQSFSCTSYIAKFLNCWHLWEPCRTSFYCSALYLNDRKLEDLLLATRKFDDSQLSNYAPDPAEVKKLTAEAQQQFETNATNMSIREGKQYSRELKTFLSCRESWRGVNLHQWCALPTTVAKNSYGLKTHLQNAHNAAKSLVTTT